MGEHPLFFTYNGQGNEGDEGHGCNEGHACHEEEGSEQDCQGPLCQGGCVPWEQGEDFGWLDRIQPDQEQEWQNREQEGFSKWQEELRPHQGLDCRCPEGQESTWGQRLCCDQEGLSSLQEGHGTLPVSTHEHVKASARGVGMSTPLERSCFGWSVLL